MTKTDVIRHFGSQSELARVLGITQPSISLWDERIPPWRQFQIEKLTNGLLKADPDCYGPAQEKSATHNA